MDAQEKAAKEKERKASSEAGDSQDPAAKIQPTIIRSPDGKVKKDYTSQSKGLDLDLIDLRKKLTDLAVSFKVPGVDLKLPLVLAPLVWIILMLGLIFTLALARRRVLNLNAQGTRILLEELKTPPSELSDIAGDFPFWLAPLPILKDPGATKAKSLRDTLGWEYKAGTNGVKVSLFLAVLLVWQFQVCYQGTVLGKAIIEHNVAPADEVKAAKRAREFACTAGVTWPGARAPQTYGCARTWNPTHRPLAAGSLVGPSAEPNALTIAVFVLTVWGAVTWWPDRVPDRYSSEPAQPFPVIQRRTVITTAMTGIPDGGRRGRCRAGWVVARLPRMSRPES